MTTIPTKPSDAQFTDHQWQAIFDEGKNILVSASAGSGKTTVLVQRVIEKIKRFTDINELLVVTYTNAAAREMKQRIQKAIQDEISKETDPKRKQHLIRQLPLLGHADISTLHSFCLKVIKRYYYLIDFDPVFRLLTDDTEISLMKEDIWEELREELYGEEDTLFEDLTTAYSNDRSDDGLTQLVFKLYDFSRSKTNSREWLSDLSSRYDIKGNDLAESTIYQDLAKPDILDTLATAKELLKDAIQISNGEPDLEGTVSILSEDLVLAESIEYAILENRLDDAYTIINNTDNFPRWKNPGKKSQDEVKEAAREMKSFRDKAKEFITAVKTRYFMITPSEQIETMAEVRTLVEELARVSSLFFDRYQQHKADRKVLDFSDLEHLTLDILSFREDGETLPSEASHHYRKQFQEVMVDEYQDINLIQETILKWLTKDSSESGNQFMVGDVKQSIYSFRLADPSLFIEKYERYDTSEDGDRIILAENFRSRNDVLSFTNFIFEQLMDKKVGELTYDQSAKLVNGFTGFPDSQAFSTSVLIYETNEEESDDSDDLSLEDVDVTFQMNTKTKGEIYMVAHKILDMVRNGYQIYDKKMKADRPIQFKDIVLLTPTKKNNIDIQDIFKQLKIPTAVNDTQNYFQTTEIAIMMSLLKIIDNPKQDIPLAAVLRSPIVGLNEVEMARIRLEDKQGSYFDALQAFVTRNDWEDQRNITLQAKLQDFMVYLDNWRTQSKRKPLIELIWLIYEDTGFLHYVGGMSSGRQRKANLHALYERAASYEKTSFKGLFQFIRFIEKMQKKDKDLAEPSAVSDGEDAVRVMTIHASKGLEFPVVFVMDMSKRFNLNDIKGSTVLDEEYGVGSEFIDVVNRIKTPTLPETVLKMQKKNRILSEQMRVLYVALTRAEQKLYLIGSYKNKEAALSKWDKVSGHSKAVLPATLRLDAQHFMDWIGRCLIRHQILDSETGIQSTNPHIRDYDTQFSVDFFTSSELEDHLLSYQNDEAEDWFESLKDGKLKAPGDADVVEAVSDALKLMTEAYPYQLASQTTSYQSVSEIKRLFEEPDDGQMVKIDVTNPRLSHRYVEDELDRPKFISDVSKPSGADIGKATHLVLQALTLSEHLTQDEIQEEVQSLVTKQVITEEMGKRIPIEKLMQFFQTPFGRYILSQVSRIKREVPFSLLLEARDIFQDMQSVDDHVLIHGIIDGYIETEEGIILFDYKTDNVQRFGEQAHEEMLKKYKGQLMLYKKALESILQKPVLETNLVLLDIGETITIEG
ncbi:helicase-exonuclease AddAB subunit AddA [Alkalibacterium olivapovliticus]|uniref:ATP-dependent helicase/nuclease subunit A n=1 Tax=Alkalibacterium olivapovliticus TaxID=99907 RepID=A0A2T0W9B4_9LACT|nr:helicase-exonuclease AddAB subunit AddA [Alkalibacterium olivapovliticus]PRY83300.1 DNA helicase/exodeoxyribonuclease V subunit A [Alkalibacterium olivapovliticus]